MANWVGSLSKMFKNRTPLSQLLPQMLDPGDPRIVLRPLGGDWLCPYTGQRVLVPDWDGSSRSLLQCPEVAQHLLSLPQLAEKGLKARMKSYEELVQLAVMIRLQEGPNYKVTSEKGEWVCPHCLGNTGIILKEWDGTEAPPDWFIPEALKHLRQCAAYLSDPLGAKPFADLRAMQGEGAIRMDLLQRVALDPIFHFSDDTGAWICPFSERSISALNLFRLPWGPAIQERIVEYLLSKECPARYSRWQTDRTTEQMQILAERINADRAAALAKQAAEREMNFLRQRLDSMKKTVGDVQEIKKDLEAARTAQLKMLPDSPPRIDGYEIAAYYEPSVHLGGDLYHFLDAGPGTTGLLIGDVSGHGVEAAVIMSAALKSFSVRSKGVASAAAVMLEVNGDLIKDLQRGKFVTAFYGVLNHRTGKLRCARAGHTAGLVVNPADGSLFALEGGGLVLGIAEQSAFAKSLKEYEVEIPHGGLLLLYTDGVTEAMNSENDEFTDARLRDVAMVCADLSALEIVSTVVSEVRAHTGGRALSDDLTVVALKRKSLGDAIEV